MRIQVENVSVAALVLVWFLGAVVGVGLGASGVYYKMNERLTVIEGKAANITAASLLARAECPENVFQEKTIMLPDGGVYKCGAVRTIPVNQRELNKWYKAEAKLLLKKGKKK